MELQSRAALQAVQERQSAAEAEMLMQHAALYKQQLDQQQEEQKGKKAFELAVDSTFQNHLKQSMDPETGEVDLPTAMARTHSTLSAISPELADKWATSQSKILAPEMRTQGQLGVQQLRNQGGLQREELKGQNAYDVQGLRNQGNLDVATLRSKSPKLDSFTTAFEGYQKALLSGDEETAKIYLGRVQKLSGQLPSAALKEGEDLAEQKLKLDQLKADPEADQVEVQRLQAVVDSMESRHGLEETEISTPGGPTVRITKGGKKEPGALTPAETTRYGEDAQAAGNALRNLNRLREQLGTGTVGAAPTVENFVFDKVLSQFGADVADKARIAGRQNIRLATQQVLGELNNRGRFSNQELTAIKEAMPSLGMTESDPNAKVKLDELRLMLAEKGAASAIAIKRPVGEEILQTLAQLFPPGSEGERAMAAEVRNGSLNANVALQVRKWQKQKGL